MCMQVAQKLYEGGAITYMRTDSVELSPEAAMCKQHIVETYGENYKFRNINQISNAKKHMKRLDQFILIKHNWKVYFHC